MSSFSVVSFLFLAVSSLTGEHTFLSLLLIDSSPHIIGIITSISFVSPFRTVVQNLVRSESDKVKKTKGLKEEVKNLFTASWFWAQLVEVSEERVWSGLALY